MISALILSLIISLLLTIAVYFTPIVVFRFMIIRRPVTNKASIAIAIVWAIISWLVFALLRDALGEEVTTNVLPALFWGYIDYYILRMQYKSTNNKPADPADEITY